MRWYYTKDDLYRGSSCNVILAQDYKIDSGSKKYARFDSASEMLSYITDQQQQQLHFYEVIPDALNHPCYVYFDMDRELDKQHDSHIINNIEEYTTNLIDRFEVIFAQFMDQIYHTQISLEKGVNYQVMITPICKTKPKLSLHIKVNIICQNITMMKSLATNLDRYMSSNLYVSTDHREYFYFDKMKGTNERILAPLIDQGVYTNFRCLRMLYSSKMKTNGRAGVPFDGFSAQIKDHLVFVHKDIEQTIISVNPSTLINREIVIDADYSKINQINITPRRVPILREKTSESCDITPNINSTHLQHIEECILRDPSIFGMFGNTIRFKNSNFLKPTVYSFMIDKTCGCTCPYANRVHSNNRSYIEYHYKHNMLKYKCFNESCIEIQMRECIQFHVRPELDSLHRLSNLNNIATLHCKQDIIIWNVTYNRESMLPYPLKQLTCVRGNMGSAKTKCLIEDFIGKHCNHPDTKCLFITYQILLSKKYFTALERYGFVNYIDQEREINANKVIVCLDSLSRITTTNFTYIFIDEVLSVLLHFNSSLIKQVNRISSMFELLLLQAKYIYVLDACVDNTIVYDFVSYLAVSKTVAPYWIRNTHIRSTNRECKVLVNRSSKAKSTSALQYSC